jgi:NADH:ubiquinone oxidoreductase subunit 6 (subunit J)
VELSALSFGLSPKTWQPLGRKVGFRQRGIVWLHQHYPRLITCFFRSPPLPGQGTRRKNKFWQAFWVGFLIALVAAFFYVAGWMIYYYTSDTAQQHLLQYADFMKEKWAASGMPAEEITRKTGELEKNMEMIKNPFFMALFTFFEPLPVGLIVSLISAFILRRRK